ncbi:hypothetical protein EIP86_000439 [Pleurotus ostreatoroseus]|nr:hypothetical protein EIP86_000439 [Pleurotus ostreatoroseus]
MDNAEWFQFVSNLGGPSASSSAASDLALNKPVAEKAELPPLPMPPAPIPTPPAQEKAESPTIVSVSTTFYPGANIIPVAPDLVFLSSDAVFFYVHSCQLLAASSNRWKGLVPQSVKTPISPTGSDKGKEREQVDAIGADVHAGDVGPVVALTEPSIVLNVVLHVVYGMSCVHYSPNAHTLLAAVDALARYGMPPSKHAVAGAPLFDLILAQAPVAPLEFYASCGSYGMHDLAAPISAYLLSYPLADLTDEVVERMGAIYLKRMVFMHLGRIEALKRLLLPPPQSHPATPECDFIEQKKLTRAWALASAYLAWDARPDLSAIAIESALYSLNEHLTCDLCKAALRDRIKQLTVQWTMVKIITEGVMTCIYSPSVDTVERVPPPSKHNFGPLYATVAEERAAIVRREQSLVEEFSKELSSFMRKQARIMDEIYETRSQFNAMAYISRLPEEVLGMILESYTADYWARWYPLMNPGRNPYTHSARPYRWIKGVLHVCRQWRRVALYTPRLWTCIAHDRIRQEEYLEFLLEYSGAAPLVLRNDDLLRHRYSGYALKHESLEDALHHFRRVETLALTLDKETVALLDKLPSENAESEEHIVDAPLMRHLLLELNLARTDNLSSLLRNVNMPGLKSLILYKAPMTLIQRLARSSLTCLDVWFDNNRFSEVEMLDLLDNLPGLQQLYIGCMVLDESAIAPQRTVSLPSLERLHLYSSRTGVIRLLLQLVFPSTTVIELSTEHGISDSLLALLMPHILGANKVGDNRDGPAHQNPTEGMRFVCPHKIIVGLEDWPRTTVTVYFWCTPTSKPIHDSEANGYRADPEMLLARDSSWYRSDTPRLTLVHTTGMFAVEEEVNTLDLRELVSLNFNVDSELHYSGYVEEVTAFCRLFQGPVFLKLETLRIDSTTAYTEKWAEKILEALTTLAAASDSTHDANEHSTSYPSIQPPSANLPLSSLHTVILHKLEIKLQVDESRPEQLHWPYAHVLDVLQHCAQQGFKFPVLKLTEAHIDCGGNFVKAADMIRAAVMELGIVDELEITWTEVTEG